MSNPDDRSGSTIETSAGSDQITDLPVPDAGEQADGVKGGLDSATQVESRKFQTLSDASRMRQQILDNSIDNMR